MESGKPRSKNVYAWREGKVTVLGSLEVGRSNFGMTGFGRKIFVLGGLVGEGSGEVTCSCEVFDLQEGRSTRIQNMATPCAGLSCTMLTESRLIKLGGVDHDGYNCNSVEIYSLPADSWETVDPSVEILNDFSLLSHSRLVRVSSRQLLIYGGIN
jgi:hypothetical protein